MLTGRSNRRWNDARWTLMMWTDLHRGYLARMKKCISTEISSSVYYLQTFMGYFVQTKNPVG
jgi:hypothetical protein